MKTYNFHLFHMKKSMFYKFFDFSVRIQDALHICLQILNSCPWLRFLIFSKKVYVLEISWDIFRKWACFYLEADICLSLFENLWIYIFTKLLLDHRSWGRRQYQVVRCWTMIYSKYCTDERSKEKGEKRNKWDKLSHTQILDCREILNIMKKLDL